MKRTSIPWAGLSLAAAVAMAVPSNAQNNTPPATQKPAPGVVTPDANQRVNRAEFRREFDVRKLVADSSAAAPLHKNATDIAECVLRRARASAPDFLGGHLAGDPEYRRLSDALAGRHKRCAEINGEATAIAISGALAEQLVAASSPQLEDRAPSVNEDDARHFFGDLSGAVTLDNIAGCLAVYSPGLTYKVLSADVGSSEETSSLGALYRQTPECHMADPPAEVPILYQRAALATALYEWTAGHPDG